MRRKNNFMDILSENWMWLHTKRLVNGYEKEISREKLNLLIATQNQTIRSDYKKSKIDNA